jgi:two-component system, OmpR family, KDP operon response regulator KdpE
VAYPGNEQERHRRHTEGDQRMTKPHIVVVEDDPSILFLVKMTLEYAGYRVTTATDGLVASTILARTRPDLLLLDMNLPGKPGWDVITELRLVDTLPIIIMSGRNFREPQIQIAASKANGYLLKPFGVDELTAAVQRFI